MSRRATAATRRRIAAVTACALVLALAVAATPARAGRSCEPRAPTVASVRDGLGLAERTVRALDASGAQVVVLARAGQDLGRWGQRWSHLGLAYRDGSAGGAWRVVHKLNHCGSDRAAIYRQGIGDFFLDDPFELAAAWAVPDAALQRRLLAVLGDTATLARLHEPAYSMVAYPWAARYQQSNQWVIETMAYAADPSASSRARAQGWLRLRGYEPAMLRIDALSRLGARVSAANVAFDDHPNAQRYAGRIETVTADSVFAWLPRAGLAAAPTVLR
jgi:hypothetical protein